MDAIFALIPILALGVAITAIVSATRLKSQRMTLEEARLRAGDAGEVDDLARQLSQLQQEMSEMQERLDFAERLLAQGKNAPALPAPPQRPA